ncbi:MAG TPA: hypothetical protein PK031_02185 [Pseudomonadales bacterium]|nr:hypothetical protein [Pseudomonadales bacterium]
MKAILPAVFFATIGLPGGIFCAVVLALIVFWAVNGKAETAEDDE